MKRNYFFKVFGALFVFLCLLQETMLAQSCTWTVNVNGSYGDQVSWELRDANSAVLLSGGNYQYGFSDTKTVENDGPVTFYVETNGNWLDNVVIYKISNSNGIIASGTLDGGKEKTVNGLMCSTQPLAQQQGCLASDYEAFPVNIYIPACAGLAETISTGAYAGQYSLVQVTQGTEYTFSSSIATDQITIGNENGSNVLAYGSGSVSWVATADQVVRFYTHVDGYCNFVNIFRERRVKCGELPPPPSNPDFPCFQGDGLASNGFENAFDITAESYYRTVDDFFVQSGTSFTMKHVRLNIASFRPLSGIYFKIYADNDGKPGDAVIATTDSVVPSKQILRGYNNIGFPVYEVSADLSQSISLSPGRYWLSPQTEREDFGSSYWEMTSTGTNGNYVYSSEGDSPWTSDDRNYNAVFFVAGECSSLSTSDIRPSEIGYYPNPVGDRLFFQTKGQLKKVTVYNLVGQTVVENLKIENGSVLTSKLQPGNYLFKIETEGGDIKTIKVTKK